LVNAAATFPFCVAGLTIDPVCRRVSGPGGDAVIEPLVMRLLVKLVERQGDVLPRRELFDHLWGNAQVGDDSLNRLVGSLRRALERTSNGAVLIETVPRVGYRLNAEPSDRSAGPRISRQAAIAGGASALLALGGAGLWLGERNARQATARRLIDRGDMLLRDAVPIEAGEAVPPLRSALAIDPGDARALGLLALAE
jgi:DNA-binding winged helix-turn-helix (wHTH) protein